MKRQRKALPEPIRLRKKMCLEIADEIHGLFGTSHVSLEEITTILETNLPLTYAESQAEWDAMEESETKPERTGPVTSVLDRLRGVLGLGKEISLVGVLDAAIDRISVICQRCDGDGKAHGADRPFEWSGPGTYPGPCPVCKGSGRIAKGGNP